MDQLLKFEADRTAINITLNSFGTELNEVVFMYSLKGKAKKKINRENTGNFILSTKICK